LTATCTEAEEALKELWSQSSWKRLAGSRAKVLERDILNDQAFACKVTVVGFCILVNEAVSNFIQAERNGGEASLLQDLSWESRSPFKIASQFLSSVLSSKRFRYSVLLRKVELAYKVKVKPQLRVGSIDHTIRVAIMATHAWLYVRGARHTTVFPTKLAMLGDDRRGRVDKDSVLREFVAAPLSRELLSSATCTFEHCHGISVIMPLWEAGRDGGEGGSE